jgi:site-specific recombinase XerD
MRSVLKSEKIRDIAIVTLLLHTGLRVAELCSLTVQDISLRDRSGHVTVYGKGNKQRQVPLNSSARKAMADWLERRGMAPGPLFLSQKGGSLSPRAVEYLVSKYAYNARLENVSPHTLRHTFCKSLIDAGVSIDRVKELAGHSDLNTTARYTRPTVRDLEKSVERISWE